ncbi:MAG: hypothetical protein WCD35_15085 [Mycobacteriales bacterium]
MSDLVRREVGELLGRLTADDVSTRERGSLLVALARALGRAARDTGSRVVVPGRLLADFLSDEVAPHLPVRDLLTLRDHHGGLSGDQLAESLIATAARVTAGVGAAAGALIGAEMVAPPALLTAPVVLAAETVAVVAVELKLVAELHVVYGRAPKGTRSQLAVAYLTSWTGKRAFDTRGAGPDLAFALSLSAKQQLRVRVVRRFGRNLSSLAPFLAGAVAGAELNRRETRSLGRALIRDLHQRR